MKKRKVLSGMRPSGNLHMGHLFGALRNWVDLQENSECFYMVADLHALTTDYEDTSALNENTVNMVLDWLTIGIDPAKSVIFRQSDILQHSELFCILSMLTPLGWLLRCPTYKEQLKEIKNKEIHTFGFLGYPVLQAADIMLYKSDAVPVGEDQLPHLELTREIARRFNNFYGNVFPEPQAILSKTCRLPGIDGRKMSKSYANAVSITETPKDLQEKIRQMFTDPKKIRKDDKGTPEGCVVFAMQTVFNPGIEELKDSCKKGLLGCVECKKNLGGFMDKFMEPLREKRNAIEKNKNIVEEVLSSGRKRAEDIAKSTMMEVKKAVKLNG